MSTISNGRIKIQNGSPIICGVYETTLTSYQGPFPVGSTVSGSFGFRGQVTNYDGGVASLHFTATGTAQPVLNEVITTSGAASGTISSFDNEPDFSSAHVGDWLYVLPDGGTTHYLIGAIPTKSQLQLTTSYAGTSNPEEQYSIGRSRTPVFGLEYPERGDKGAGEIVKRMAFDIEELLASGTALASLSVENFTATSAAVSTSLTISGVPVATGDELEEFRTEGWPGYAPTFSGGNYTLLSYAPYSVRIDSMRGRTGAGTVSGTLKINGTDIQGIRHVAWNTSESAKTATSSNTISLGDRLTFTASGVGNVHSFEWTIIGRRM